MKIKVSETTNTQLDWLVAKAQGYAVYHSAMLNGHIMHGFWVSGYYPGDLNSWVPLSKFSPSTNWSQGGPIIEREKIELGWVVEHWQANKAHNYNKSFHGSDPQHPLIAAMRCFVASKLGDEVEVPDELA